MNRPTLAHGLVAMAGLAVWLFLVASPLAITAAVTADHWAMAGRVYAPQTLHSLIARSIGLAVAVAFGAVVLGYISGRVLATADRGRTWLLWLMLVPILWPQYVACYAWSLLLGPTAPLGWLVASQSADENQVVRAAVACFVQVLWCWPLAALIIARGRQCVRSDTPGIQAAGQQGRMPTLAAICHPLGQSVAVAFAVCFVLALCQYDAFSIAGVRTYGTELVAIYKATGSTESVARASWPLVAVAVAMAIVLRRRTWLIDATCHTADAHSTVSRIQWAALATVLILSLAVPVMLLLMGICKGDLPGSSCRPDRAGLVNALAAAVLAAGLALSMAAAAVVLERSGRWAAIVSRLMQVSLIAAAFIPGALVGVALLEAAPAAPSMVWLMDRWPAVALGQAVRFAGLAVLLFLVARSQIDRGRLATPCDDPVGTDDFPQRRPWWPVVWRASASVLLLVAALSVVELSATMLLRPPGAPHSTQWLFSLMQRHPDGLASVSCLLLMVATLPVSGLVALLWRSPRP